MYAMILEVANLNTTRHTCLASTILKLEQRKNEEESVEADDVKESLLEHTRNPQTTTAKSIPHIIINH
ncbi:glucuronokinase [Salvia divinorum]|uniref:Glucuronokinase n=1 Tax=Salvia divinorum TaxID=28513 RepID=A0ABD1I6F8_SALDI